LGKILFGLLALALTVYGGLIGNSVTLTTYYPDLATPTSSIAFLVTDPGVEEACNVSTCFLQPGAYSLDLNDQSNAFTQILSIGEGFGTREKLPGYAHGE